jgi:hypothetical protein
MGAIFIKFVIVLSIAIGVAALGAGKICDPNGQSCGGFSTILAAIAIFCTAVVLPYNIINMLIIQPLFATPSAVSNIFGGAFNAGRASMVPMGTSEQIYANIRHNASARISHGAAHRSFTSMPRLAGPRNFMGRNAGPIKSFVDAPTSSAVRGAASNIVHSGGGLSSTSGNAGNPPRNLWGRVKTAVTPAVSGGSRRGPGVSKRFRT